MKQYKFKSENFVEKEQIPDAYIDQSSLREIQRLAGVEPRVESMTGINISNTGMEKAELMRKHNIKPGTPEWFQLWFSLPYLTGEKPVDKK